MKTASKPSSSRICSMVNRRPTSVLHSNLMPSLRRFSISASTTALGSRKSGMPYLSAGFELFRPKNQILGTKSENADHIRAILFESTGLRENWCDAQTPANADDLFLSCERARHPHGPNQPIKRGPDLTELLHLFGRLTDRLDDQGHGSVCAVEVGDRKGNPFTGLMQQHNDELTRPSGSYHQRVMDDQRISNVGKIFTS